MSHSITLFSELSLIQKRLILVNYSNFINTKIRIRKTDILTKGSDNSGYKLDYSKNLIFLENHLNPAYSNENKKILNQFLNDVKQFELKSKIKIDELQKSTSFKQSRLITSKLDFVKA